MIEQRPAVQAGVSINSVDDGAIMVLAVRGRWSVALRIETFDVLRRCLTAHPAGVLIDLTGLDDPEALSLPAWAKVCEVSAAGNPPVLVAVCASPEMALPHRLQEAGSRRYLPVFAKPRKARTALSNLIPAADRLVLHIPAVVYAPTRARRLIDSACRSWGLQSMLFNTRLIVSELVANAVSHAGTDIHVTALRRDGRLQVIVADEDPRLPQVPTPEPGARLISGLHMVQAVAERWSSIPTAGGKLVWALPRGR